MFKGMLRPRHTPNEVTCGLMPLRQASELVSDWSAHYKLSRSRDLCTLAAHSCALGQHCVSAHSRTSICNKLEHIRLFCKLVRQLYTSLQAWACSCEKMEEASYPSCGTAPSG